MNIETQLSNRKTKKLKKLISDLKSQRSIALYRISAISQKNDARHKTKERKPFKQFASHVLPKRRARTFGELENVLKELSTDKNNTIDILFGCTGVRLFYVENNGEVIHTCEHFALRIGKLAEDCLRKLDETFFLQLVETSDPEVDNGQHQASDQSFVYQLIPEVSTCTRINLNGYVLPDVQRNDGSAIGLIIPESVNELLLDILHQILKIVDNDDRFLQINQKSSEIVIIDDDDDIVSGRKQSEISRGDEVSVVSGAQRITHTMIKAAELTGELINFSTPYILSAIRKAPRNEPPVSNEVYIAIKADA